MGGVDHPVSVVASGLGAAFVVRAAADRPSLFDRVVLVAPTGLEARHIARTGPQPRLVQGLLRLPLLGQGGYNLVATRRALRGALGRGGAGQDRRATAAWLDYLYLAAHQPGARFALASLYSGLLDAPLAATYPDLPQPILLVWGKSARQRPLEQARAFRQANPRADIRVLAAGDRPHEHAADEFARAVRAWLRAPSTSRSP
jgi:pimeloyl-ACP methyl ester carboxylesterase